MEGRYPRPNPFLRRRNNRFGKKEYYPSDQYASTQFKPIADSSHRNEIRVNAAFEIEQQQRPRAQTQNSPVSSNIQGRKKTYDDQFASWDNNQEAADRLLQIMRLLGKYATPEEMQRILAGGWQMYALGGDCVLLDQILAMATRVERWLNIDAQIQAAMRENQRAARVTSVTNSTPRHDFKREGYYFPSSFNNDDYLYIDNPFQPPLHYQRFGVNPAASPVTSSGLDSYSAARQEARQGPPQGGPTTQESALPSSRASLPKDQKDIAVNTPPSKRAQYSTLSRDLDEFRKNLERDFLAEVTQHISSQGSLRNMYQPPAHQRQSTDPSARQEATQVLLHTLTMVRVVLMEAVAQARTLHNFFFILVFRLLRFGLIDNN
ncbi:MAG: hypothetical protein M3Y53_10975 [Thermoproteota archaeon]|nr:hypothetical protein [Thermoproteota archaeon]